ncbi:hypothetical protein [Pseudomonas sp. BMS12]|uniref:hypothetical protein n=1 Tax=Pseudomonas sp. BMS12 TaxID=1796033 RepID=UPI00083A3A1A|nr:hypothetical protein [Pseudomonas sp. BMS12]
MPRPLLLALCLIGSTALAGPLPRGVHHVPKNPALDSPSRLIFTRDNNAPNACDVELYVNQQVMATLGPGKSASLDLPNGPFSIAVAISPKGYCGGQGPGPSQSVLLAPGETRQFAVIVKPGQAFIAPMLN